MKTSVSLLKTATAWLVLLPILGLQPVQAQPDVNNAPKADNPVNRPVRPNLNALPLAERARERTRFQLQQLGATTPAMQEALLTYIETETTARQTLVEKARNLQIGVLGNAFTDAQVATRLNDYLAVIEEDKTRRETAQATLKKTADVSKMPKIEAMLTLMGLYGQAPMLLPSGALGMANGRAGLQNGLNRRGMLQDEPNGALPGPQPTIPRINRRRLLLPPPTPPAQQGAVTNTQI